jgi:hypothetical protein
MLKRKSGMKCSRAAIALFFFLWLVHSIACADDFGPKHEVGTLRADAHVLLAHRARLAKVDPNAAVISDVIIAGDQAVLSWDVGKQHGLMGLVRQNHRWWDALDKTPIPQTQCWSTLSAYPLKSTILDGFAPSTTDLQGYSFAEELLNAAESHNVDVRRFSAYAGAPPKSGEPRLVLPAGCALDVYFVPPDLTIRPAGGLENPTRTDTNGYDLSLAYAANDAPPASKFSQFYARAPTAAEFLPYPTPYRVVADAVMFFDITIDATKLVSFGKGTTLEVWFPFALDDKLRYSMSIGGALDPITPVVGSVYDNVVHFTLPAFTVIPKQPLMGEIDGEPR